MTTTDNTGAEVRHVTQPSEVKRLVREGWAVYDSGNDEGTGGQWWTVRRRVACPCCGGKPDSFTAWVVRYITGPLNRATIRRSRITPALRERCVRYALEAGASHDTERRAQEIAAYITQEHDQ